MLQTTPFSRLSVPALTCAALAASLAVSCVQSPAAAPAPATEPRAKRATLVFSTSTAGQIVPCGCSPDQRGGLPRAAALLRKLRKEVPGLVYVGAGDLLFDGTARPRGPSAGQAERKARTLARGDELLGAAARAVGVRDLALGAAFVESTRGAVPLLDAGAAPLGAARATLLVHAGEVQVGLFAAGLGEDPGATIAARAAQLRREGAQLVVLLAHPRGEGAWRRAQELARIARPVVDLVVVGHLDDPETDPNRADPGPPPLLSVEGHGQSLLRVDALVPEGAKAGAPIFLSRGAAGKAEELKALDDRIARLRAQAAQAPDDLRERYLAKVKELDERKRNLAASEERAPAGAIVLTASFLPLAAEVGDDPEAKALVEAYDAQVIELNLRAAKELPEACPPPGKGEPAFIGVSAAKGAQGCASCHPTQTRFWEETKHAHAYETLVGVNKQFSLDCVRCHVTGWQQPGGVCRIDRTEVGGPGFGPRRSGLGRRDVQCEMCHGPGSEHAADPPEHVELKVPASVCLRCHEPANSPHFDDARYRPFIVGPGHGEPLARGEKPHPRARGAGPNAPAPAAKPAP